MSFILVFALVSFVTAFGIILMLGYRWLKIKDTKVSFPEDFHESFFDILLKKLFSDEKLEKQIIKQCSLAGNRAIQSIAQLRQNIVLMRARNRTHYFFRKRKVVPEKKTSSLFLKSIAEHKRKAHEEK